MTPVCFLLFVKTKKKKGDYYMNKYSEITPEIYSLAEMIKNNCLIEPELYQKYEVKRGLRDISGKGVLAGLTEICEVHSYTIVDNEYVPCEVNYIIVVLT